MENKYNNLKPNEITVLASQHKGIIPVWPRASNRHQALAQLQTGPKGCHSEKRKKRGKTTVPHVDIKKKRTLANCTTTTGWKSPADTTWSREFWVYSFYFRKASTQFLQLLKYGLNRFSHYYKSIVK